MNTREQRAKDKLMAERQRLVERAKVLNPAYRPPPDYRPFSTKKIRKIYVPVKEYPDYNFIGLILGPRGMTQRQMEQDTGAKISLRGKGSVREGKGRSATKDNNEDEDLHVVISGDSEDSLDHAESLVRRLLVPVEEGKNDIKRKQLRKLAEITGTLRDNSYGFEREERAKRASGLDVYCKWCGETSHPSSDCHQRGRAAAPPPSAGPKVVTQEYYDLMLSFGEDVSNMVVQSSPAAPSNASTEGYNSLLSAIGVQASDASPSPSSAHFPPSSSSSGGPPFRSGPNHSFTGRYGGSDDGRGFSRPRDFPQPVPSDDIPPWERMEREQQQPQHQQPPTYPPQPHQQPYPTQPPRSDAPAPWDL